MANVRIGFLLCAALATAPAFAQWKPSWDVPWQYMISPRSMNPGGVRVADDGRIFALLDLGHDGRAHAAVACFDEAGGGVWLREFPNVLRMDLQLLPSGHVAVVDQFGPVIRVRVHDGDSGDVVWDDESFNGRLAAGRRALAIAANGDLLIAAVEGDDMVVFRYTADGEKLPSWRWSPGPEDLQADDIVITADGGAIVGGAGDVFTGGFLVVRFDAAGQVVYSDRELGDHGTTHTVLSIEIDNDGETIAAGAPENASGASQARVWKLAADGTRRWTRDLTNPLDDRFGVTIGAIALSGRGELLIASDLLDYGPFRVLRIDPDSGAILQVAMASIGGMLTGMAQTPNGRVLIAGFHFIDSQGHIGARMVEFDTNLSPCREADLDTRFFAVTIAGSAQGWTVAGGTLFTGMSNDFRLLRYDSDGACSPLDVVFANGFEEPVAGGN